MTTRSAESDVGLTADAAGSRNRAMNDLSPINAAEIETARAKLDTQVREMIQWHFSPETGCPFWLEWASKAGWDPRQEVKTFDHVVSRFPHFQDEWLRDLQPEVWVPARFKGRPYN